MLSLSQSILRRFRATTEKKTRAMCIGKFFPQAMGILIYEKTQKGVGYLLYIGDWGWVKDCLDKACFLRLRS